MAARPFIIWAVSLARLKVKGFQSMPRLTTVRINQTHIQNKKAKNQRHSTLAWKDIPLYMNDLGGVTKQLGSYFETFRRLNTHIWHGFHTGVLAISMIRFMTLLVVWSSPCIVNLRNTHWSPISFLLGLWKYLMWGEIIWEYWTLLVQSMFSKTV